MSKVFIDDTNLTNIANAIRSKNGSTDTYLPSAMAPAIEALSVGDIDTSDATATESDIVNGQTAYVNGTKITGTLVVQNYYTGTTTPESTTGNDGDLYFKVTR